MTDRGFTLAEVLVALVIFSVAAVSLAHLVTGLTAGTGHARAMMLARIEADNRLVEAVADPSVLGAGTMKGTGEQRGQRFNWTRQIDLRDTNGLAGIQVTVSDPATGQQLALRETLVQVTP